MRRLPPALMTTLVLALLATGCDDGPELQRVEHPVPEIPVVSATALGPGNDLHLVEWRDDAPLHRVRLDGAPVPGAADPQSPLHCPFALAVDHEGTTFAITSEPGHEQAHTRIEAIDPGTGARLTGYDLPEGGLDLAIDGAGRLYVPLVREHGIARIDPAAEDRQDWAADASLARPVSIAIAPDGRAFVIDLLVGDQSADDRAEVVILDGTGSVLERWPAEDLPPEPVAYDIAVDVDRDRVWLTAAGRLLAYTLDGERIGTFEPERAGSGDTAIPDCTETMVPPRITAGGDGHLFWSPGWREAFHQPAHLHVFRLE